MGTSTEELKQRVEARKKDLEARMAAAKADAAGASDEAARKVKKRLDELQAFVRDGWENLTDETVGKLNSWLKKD